MDEPEVPKLNTTTLYGPTKKFNVFESLNEFKVK